MNKFELVRHVISNDSESVQQTFRLLDVGCRGCELKPYVTDFVEYEGVDLYQNDTQTVDHVLDASKELSFQDRIFDYVVALDLVEHIDDFQGVLNELLRITKKSLIIMLPNNAHLFFRLRFLLTGRLSGKYDLLYGYKQDRHRWVTILTQSDNYMRHFAAENNGDLNVVWHNDSRKKRLLERIGKLFSLSPSLWVWASLYVINKK